MLPQLLLMGSLAAAPPPIRFITNRMCPLTKLARARPAELEQAGSTRSRRGPASAEGADPVHA